MNTLPPFVRILIRILLGLNGYVLSVAGFIATAGVAVELGHNSKWAWPKGLLTFVAFVAMGMIGFLMVAAADVLAGARYQGIPPNRIAAIVFTELAQMTFAVLSFSSLFGMLDSIQSRPFSWGWTLFLFVSISGFIASLWFKRARRE